MNIVLKKITALIISVMMIMSIGMPTSALAYSDKVNSAESQELQADIQSIEVLPLSELSSINNLAEDTLDESSSTILNSNFLQNSRKADLGFVTMGFSAAKEDSITVTVLNVSNSSIRTTNLKVKLEGRNYNATYNIAKRVWPVGITNVKINWICSTK